MTILSDIRSQVAAKVSTVSGFHLTKQTPDYFGRTQNTIAHRAFAVQMAATSQMNERQRRSVGVYSQSVVRVIFAYRLRPTDAYPTDYDLMLDAEVSVINACLATYSDQPFQIRYESSSRAIPDSQEYAIITIEFTTYHTITP